MILMIAIVLVIGIGTIAFAMKRNRAARLGAATRDALTSRSIQTLFPNGIRFVPSMVPPKNTGVVFHVSPDAVARSASAVMAATNGGA